MFDDPLPPWVNTTSTRVNAGLGTIARVVASGETIYRGKLRFTDAERRIRHCWQPYHDTLAALITGTRAVFGGCLLVDCHSMPAQGTPQREGPQSPAIVAPISCSAMPTAPLAPRASPASSNTA